MYAAMDVFWRQGYERTSVPDLAAATGLSTSSLYNAYGSKLGLFTTVLERYLVTVLQPMQAPLRDGQDGVADVDAYLDILEATLAVEPPRGCLMVNTIGEFREPAPELAALTERYRSGLRTDLGEALTRAADRDEIPATTIDERVASITSIVVAFNLLVAAHAPVAESRGLLGAARAIAGAG